VGLVWFFEVVILLLGLFLLGLLLQWGFRLRGFTWRVPVAAIVALQLFLQAQAFYAYFTVIRPACKATPQEWREWLPIEATAERPVWVRWDTDYTVETRKRLGQLPHFRADEYTDEPNPEPGSGARYVVERSRGEVIWSTTSVGVIDSSISVTDIDAERTVTGWRTLITTSADFSDVPWEWGFLRIGGSIECTVGGETPDTWLMNFLGVES
jgi:hypothetical protein